MPIDVEMGRLTVQLPVETIDQIGKWATAAGLKRGQFASVALVIGSQQLARQVAPENYLTPEIVKGIIQAVGAPGSNVEDALRAGHVTLKLS